MPIGAHLDSDLASDELELLLDTVQRSKFLGKHLEVGTVAKGTLWRLASRVRPDNSHRFVIIDPILYQPDQLELIQKNLLAHGIHPDKIDLRAYSSQEAFERAERQRESFDFIFLDSHKKLRHIAQDLRWTRLLNVGGKIAIHDYGVAHSGVRLAVNRFLKKYPFYRKAGHVRNLIIIEKKDKAKKKEVSDMDLLLAEIFTPILSWKTFLKRL